MTTATTEPDINHEDRVTLEKLAVLHDFIVVWPLAVPSKKRGALLHMPETAGEREKSHRGVVLAIGPGDWNEQGSAVLPMSVGAGDLVFFGKFAGTEEDLDGRTVLVMREQEIRFCVRAGGFRVVQHENPKLDHLVEDWCEICHGVPAEEAAAESLALEREALQLQRVAVCGCGHAGERHAHLTGPCQNCDTCLTFQALGAEPSVTVDEFGTGDISVERRPCAEPGCLLMQQRQGNAWIGARCGHTHPALVVTG